MDVVPGARAERTHVVGEGDTAALLGSGTLAVLGTPRLLAWLEGATVAALVDALDAGETSVGVRVAVEHLRASAVGDLVTVSAAVVAVDGRRVVLDVAAAGPDGEPVARGTVERVVVDASRFLARLARP